jgi:putative endonuclease
MQNALHSFSEAGLVNMRYVYLLQSLSDSTKRYIGLAYDVEERVMEHNSGKSIYTNKHKPWLIAQFGFESEQKAFDFERYLKHGSGHAFAKRHFW